MPRPNYIALLDVDDTCSSYDGVGTYTLNENLFKALNKSGISKVYLFTSMDTSTVIGEMQFMTQGLMRDLDSVELTRMIKNIYSGSRLGIIQKLQDMGIKVLGVVTPPDTNEEMNPDRKPGHMFTTYMQPSYYKKLIDLVTEPTIQKLEALNAYITEFKNNEENAAIDAKMQPSKKLSPAESVHNRYKGAMAEMLFERLPKDSMTSFFFFDDNEKCLDRVSAVSKSEQFKQHVTLIPIKVDVLKDNAAPDKYFDIMINQISKHDLKILTQDFSDIQNKYKIVNDASHPLRQFTALYIQFVNKCYEQASGYKTKLAAVHMLAMVVTFLKNPCEETYNRLRTLIADSAFYKANTQLAVQHIETLMSLGKQKSSYSQSLYKPGHKSDPQVSITTEIPSATKPPKSKFE